MQKVTVTLELQDCEDGVWLVGPNWLVNMDQLAKVTAPKAWAEERLAEGCEVEAVRAVYAKELETPEDWIPGEIGCHELVDRISVFATIWDNVLDHPACISNPEWFQMANHISDLIGQLYQEIGAKHFGD